MLDFVSYVSVVVTGHLNRVITLVQVRSVVLVLNLGLTYRFFTVVPDVLSWSSMADLASLTLIMLQKVHLFAKKMSMFREWRLYFMWLFWGLTWTCYWVSSMV